MWLAVTKNVPVTQIKSHTYHYTNLNAVNHAYKVASGLDSMILGETQILGQMKQASKLAEYANTQGKHLAHLFQKIFETAKEVRTKTKIGASSTTVASSILKVSKSIFGDITQTSILFVGAGDMAELCAKYFTDQKPSTSFTGVQLPPAFGALNRISIPAGEKAYTVTDEFTLPIDVEAFAVSAHAHADLPH